MAIQHVKQAVAAFVRFGRKGSILMVPAVLPNIRKAQEGYCSEPQHRKGLTERSGRMPFHAEASGWIG